MGLFVRDIRAFWQLDGRGDSNLALIDPVFGLQTYGELRAGIAGFATRLARHAEALGTDRLLIAIEMSARSPVVAAYLAALASHHVVLIGAPGDFALGRALVDSYAPNLIITMTDDQCSLIPLSPRPAGLHPDLMLLLSTSGTTGDPKLVRLSADNLSSNAAAIADYLNLREDDRAVTTLPLHYIFGLSVLHAHLQAGAAVVLTDLSVIDAGFAHLFTSSRGTSISVVPHQIDLLLANGFRANSLPGLRHIAQAGGKLAPVKVCEMAEKARQGGWSFFVMYGQTEASPRMAYLPPEAAHAHPDCVGKAIAGGSFVIRDENGVAITDSGLPGALIYSGPNVMMGYAYSRDDLALAKDTFELATGDIAERTAAGYIKIVGRSARFVKLFGLRLSLDQIEAMLRNTGIDVYAVAVDDHLVLMLPEAGSETAARDLVAKTCKLPLASIQTAHLAGLPVLPSGKVDLKKLESLARAAKRPPPPDQANAQTLDKVLAEATRRGFVSLDDTYTGLGGDSLGYLQVQIYLERHLGTAPPGWENMTLRQLRSFEPDPAKLASVWSSVEIEVALRVAAITCVILVHLGRLPVGGGTWLLVLLMGYSFARFQRPRLIDGHYRDVLFRMLHPILLLYAVLLLSYHLVKDDVALGYVLLLGNALPPGPGSLLTVYWFVSLYAQLVLVMVAAFLISPFRRAQDLQPWLASALMFAFGTGLAMAFLWLTPDPFPNDRYPGIFGSPIAARSLVVCFPMLLLGMMIYSARGRLQYILTIAGLVVTCLIFPYTSQSQPFILAGGGLLLIWGKAVPLPTLAVRAVTLMAASTLFVYLLHNIVVHVVRTATPTLDVIGLPAAIALVVPTSFVVGHVTKLLFDALDRKVADWWRARRAPQPRPDEGK